MDQPPLPCGIAGTVLFRCSSRKYRSMGVAVEVFPFGRLKFHSLTHQNRQVLEILDCTLLAAMKNISATKAQTSTEYLLAKPRILYTARDRNLRWNFGT